MISGQYRDPDEWEPDISHSTCPWHKANPGKPFAGCTCSASYGMKRRDPAEVAAIKAKRRREHEDAVLAEADQIRARRAATTPPAGPADTGETM